ncbi:Uncharacterized protein Fot_57587 [Forsythia ovata]|uniref:Uncharacterized protein n=1 Tax=Forsythia ovata TaxID=205694 RepID=A0ABD1NUT6_9LAMI
MTQNLLPPGYGGDGKGGMFSSINDRNMVVLAGAGAIVAVTAATEAVNSPQVFILIYSLIPSLIYEIEVNNGDIQISSSIFGSINLRYHVGKEKFHILIKDLELHQKELTIKMQVMRKETIETYENRNGPLNIMKLILMDEDREDSKEVHVHLHGGIKGQAVATLALHNKPSATD